VGGEVHTQRREVRQVEGEGREERREWREAATSEEEQVVGVTWRWSRQASSSPGSCLRRGGEEERGELGGPALQAATTSPSCLFTVSMNESSKEEVEEEVEVVFSTTTLLSIVSEAITRHFKT